MAQTAQMSFRMDVRMDSGRMDDRMDRARAEKII